MRKHYPVAALAAVGLVAAAGPAYAELGADPAVSATPFGTASETIVLPTGAEIRPAAGGAYTTEPAPGGSSAFVTSTEPDGDRLVIPVDALEGIGSGAYTFEQFNIDAMARSGITDSGDPAARSLLAAEAEPEATGETVSVDVTGLWSDGSAPDVIYLSFLDLDTNAYRSGIITEGTATIEMNPGHYHFAAQMVDTEEQRDILGLLEATVDADTGALVIDGAEARPAGFQTDRETVRGDFTTGIFSFAPGTDDGIQTAIIGGGEWSASVIPAPAGLAGRDIGIMQRSELTSPPGAEEPYSYSLYERSYDGVPADPVIRVRDCDLARVEMEYQSLGVDAQMSRLNYVYNAAFREFNFAHGGSVDLPSDRTEFYSAGPGLEWWHMGEFRSEEDEPDEQNAAEDADEASLADAVIHYGGELDPSARTKATWNEGPITVGLDAWTPTSAFPMFARLESESLLVTRAGMFSSGSADEAIESVAPGQTVLGQDGLGVNKSQDGGFLLTDLGLVPEGRYTLYAEAHRTAPWTPLGTASTAEWSFATAPGDADALLDVSVVNFDAEGIVNGYAEAGEDQDVELVFTTQSGAEQRHCTAMTFEVSYDDGATWEAVELDREGDRADAELEHPEGAEFVSVRFTAADDQGNTVAHSTIRSYGLR